jgi:imidazolonepropionase-like amidohydrolase
MAPAAVRAAADRIWTMGWPFHSRRRLAELRLIATDTDRTRGDGPAVEGPIDALLLLMTGRTASLPRLAGPGVPQPLQGESMLTIRASRLFDGVDATVIDQPVVHVDAGRIVAVRSGGDPPADAEVVDLGDVTLLPGLVDAHQHLSFDASPDPVGHLDDYDDGQLLDNIRAAGRTALAAGITTVRDLGDRDYLSLAFRAETAATPTAGPHLIAAGPPITTAKGHCWYLGGEADGVDGVRAAVRAHADRGVDVIKVMATGGELTPGTRSHEAQYSRDELAAITDEAHRLGLPVTAHAHGGGGIGDAVAAGVDMLEHCSFFTADGGAKAEPETLDAIARAGIVVSLTMGARPGLPMPPRMVALLPMLVNGVKLIRASGATIVCSSDAGIAPAKPHDVLPYGPVMYVGTGGAATVEALSAVTSIAADACGVGARKGRLAAGYDADILAVRGNPLEDIGDLLEVAAVFRLGTRVR